MELSDVESFSLLFKMMWEDIADNERCRLNILDTICYKDGRPYRWLFTSEKTGEILRKKQHRLNPLEVIKGFRARYKLLKGRKPRQLSDKIAVVYYYETLEKLSIQYVDEKELLKLINHDDPIMEIAAIQLYIGAMELNGCGMFEHVTMSTMKSANVKPSASGQTYELKAFPTDDTGSILSYDEVYDGIIDTEALAIMGSDTNSNNNITVQRQPVTQSQDRLLGAISRKLAHYLESRMHSQLYFGAFQFVFNTHWIPFLSGARSLIFPHTSQDTIYNKDRLVYFSDVAPVLSSSYDRRGLSQSYLQRMGMSKFVHFKSQQSAGDDSIKHGYSYDSSTSYGRPHRSASFAPPQDTTISHMGSTVTSSDGHYGGYRAREAASSESAAVDTFIQSMGDATNGKGSFIRPNTTDVVNKIALSKSASVTVLHVDSETSGGGGTSLTNIQEHNKYDDDNNSESKPPQFPLPNPGSRLSRIQYDQAMMNIERAPGGGGAHRHYNQSNLTPSNDGNSPAKALTYENRSSLSANAWGDTGVTYSCGNQSLNNNKKYVELEHAKRQLTRNVSNDTILHGYRNEKERASSSDDDEDNGHNKLRSSTLELLTESMKSSLTQKKSDRPKGHFAQSNNEQSAVQTDTAYLSTINRRPISAPHLLRATRKNTKEGKYQALVNEVDETIKLAYKNEGGDENNSNDELEASSIKVVRKLPLQCGKFCYGNYCALFKQCGDLGVFNSQKLDIQKMRALDQSAKKFENKRQQTMASLFTENNKAADGTTVAKTVGDENKVGTGADTGDDSKRAMDHHSKSSIFQKLLHPVNIVTGSDTMLYYENENGEYKALKCPNQLPYKSVLLTKCEEGFLQMHLQKRLEFHEEDDNIGNLLRTATGRSATVTPRDEKRHYGGKVTRPSSSSSSSSSSLKDTTANAGTTKLNASKPINDINSLQIQQQRVVDEVLLLQAKKEKIDKDQILAALAKKHIMQVFNQCHKCLSQKPPPPSELKSTTIHGNEKSSQYNFLSMLQSHSSVLQGNSHTVSHVSRSGLDNVWEQINAIYKEMVYEDTWRQVQSSRFYYTVPVCDVCFKFYTLIEHYRDAIILHNSEVTDSNNHSHSNRAAVTTAGLRRPKSATELQVKSKLKHTHYVGLKKNLRRLDSASSFKQEERRPSQPISRLLYRQDSNLATYQKEDINEVNARNSRREHRRKVQQQQHEHEYGHHNQSFIKRNDVNNTSVISLLSNIEINHNQTANDISGLNTNISFLTDVAYCSSPFKQGNAANSNNIIRNEIEESEDIEEDDDDDDNETDQAVMKAGSNQRKESIQSQQSRRRPQQRHMNPVFQLPPDQQQHHTSHGGGNSFADRFKERMSSDMDAKTLPSRGRLSMLPSRGDSSDKPTTGKNKPLQNSDLGQMLQSRSSRRGLRNYNIEDTIVEEEGVSFDSTSSSNSNESSADEVPATEIGNARNSNRFSRDNLHDVDIPITIEKKHAPVFGGGGDENKENIGSSNTKPARLSMRRGGSSEAVISMNTRNAAGTQHSSTVIGAGPAVLSPNSKKRLNAPDIAGRNRNFQFIKEADMKSLIDENRQMLLKGIDKGTKAAYGSIHTWARLIANKAIGEHHKLTESIEEETERQNRRRSRHESNRRQQHLDDDEDDVVHPPQSQEQAQITVGRVRPKSGNDVSLTKKSIKSTKSLRPKSAAMQGTRVAEYGASDDERTYKANKSGNVQPGDSLELSNDDVPATTLPRESHPLLVTHDPMLEAIDVVEVEDDDNDDAFFSEENENLVQFTPAPVFTLPSTPHSLPSANENIVPEMEVAHMYDSRSISYNKEASSHPQHMTRSGVGSRLPPRFNYHHDNSSRSGETSYGTRAPNNIYELGTLLEDSVS